ncbi:glycosyltransferase [Eubacterium sp.]|uniref:glycosyltransferase n=1 Tax=Eubacterium sp. TaxID=142586 RepID=UPI0025892D23|nr:glycosyltransferase [Eubacterium sp.]MCR5368474.1 glycosyltransferase [Eubacterium sp.]
MINQYLKKGKKVLFFVDGFVGGAGNVVQILAKEFAKKGCNVRICCLGGTTQGRHDLTGVSVVGYKKKGSKLSKYLCYIYGAKREIKVFNPDCVISFLFGISAFVGISVRKKRKYLFIPSERSNPSSLKPHGIIQKLVRSAYKKADGIVVLFDSFKRLEDGLFESKCYTIPNPVQINDISDKSEVSSPIKFITIANESKPKGLDLLIKSFEIAVKSHPEIQLFIYGKIFTDDLPSYIRDKKLENNIHLKGYTQEVNVVLSEADVYIMPSRYEGFPNSLCEAMAAGKACIAFECHKGISELIKNNENGIVVPAENTVEMATRIVELTESPEKIKALGRKAKDISTKFSVDLVVNMWDELLFGLNRDK